VKHLLKIFAIQIHVKTKVSVIRMDTVLCAFVDRVFLVSIVSLIQQYVLQTHAETMPFVNQVKMDLHANALPTFLDSFVKIVNFLVLFKITNLFNLMNTILKSTIVPVHLVLIMEYVLTTKTIFTIVVVYRVLQEQTAKQVR